MAKAQKTKMEKPELDSVYFLKILLYFTLGASWIGSEGSQILPIGLILGVLLAQHEKLRMDRKIEYAILLVASILGLYGLGLTVSVG
jgi:hypothetical protein